MAARFSNANVARDTAAWIEIWGPARTILQQCVRVKGLGGVITENGMCRKECSPDKGLIAV